MGAFVLLFDRRGWAVIGHAVSVSVLGIFSSFFFFFTWVVWFSGNSIILVTEHVNFR